MASPHDEVLNTKVQALRQAADQLDAVRGQTPQQVEQALVEAQSCCGTCTGVSFIPPCMNACIAVSPLF
jgi:mannitol/fructose-specific phosphotransferase system IIA component (Ntr-type)